METRTNTSFSFDQPVAITRLAKAEGNCAGRFVSWSDEGINIRVESGLKVGSVVKLEVGEDLMVAEVSHCKEEGSEYVAGLALLERIGKSELERLQRELCAA